MQRGQRLPAPQRRDVSCVRVVRGCGPGVSGRQRSPCVTGTPAHLSHREPIFNVPRVVVWLLAAFFAVHIVRQLLPEYQNGSHGVMDVMCRQLVAELGRALPAGQPVADHACWRSFRPGSAASPATCRAAIRRSSPRLARTCSCTGTSCTCWSIRPGCWPSAAPIARRLDTPRFLLFFLMTGAAGALFFTAVQRIRADHADRRIRRHLGPDGGGVPLHLRQGRGWRAALGPWRTSGAAHEPRGYLARPAHHDGGGGMGRSSTCWSAGVRLQA